MERIGLFPLYMVLYPEAVMPLHVFEDRYKLLINHCFDSKKEFGMTLIDPVKIFHTGCCAIVSDIFRRYDDGKMDIIIKGTRRFKIMHIIDGKEQYLLSDIEFFDDKPEVQNESLLIDCIEQYNKIADSLKELNIEKIDIIKLETKVPSFLISQKSGLTLYQRQELLEMRSENLRLEYLRFHLEKVIPMVKEAEWVAKIVKNDGFMKPDGIK